MFSLIFKFTTCGLETCFMLEIIKFNGILYKNAIIFFRRYHMLASLKEFRRLYFEMQKQLPFLDCYISDLKPFWDDLPAEAPTAYKKLSCTEGNPRLVIQTEHSFEEISAMAKAEPEVNFIIASGDKKMLYHIEPVTRLLQEVPNLYLATGNLCNTFALERLIDAGCKDKLLYGSMFPFLSPGEALAQVVLGRFDWETRCAIAGNNFRRLLGEEPVIPEELPEIKIPALFIDAHGHTLEENTPSRFPAPGSRSVWESWEEKLDFFGLTNFLFTPSETIGDASKFNAKDLIGSCCEDSAGRMRYFEGFDPRYLRESLENLEKSLPDPMCVGIKIHPAGHRTDADSPLYEEVFKIAAKYGKPIMTHSWGISDYNPVQKHSTPERFECHLKAYPEVRFVFGHTGGRPNGFPAAAKMINKYPQCMGDFSGDLFFNGHIRHAVSEIGADRLMFGTDMYWIDPRCTMGMLLEIEDLSDEDFLKIASLNAKHFYGV